MRALVTGGAGQIGSRLCTQLLEDGCSVICVDNLSTGDSRNLEALQGESGFSFSHHDVSEPIELAEKVDVVYHLASPASPPDFPRMPLETLAANSLGTGNMLRLAADHKATFLFASTSEVYGEPLIHPQGEEYWGNVNPVGVRSCYDEGKRFGEALVMAWVRQRRIDARIVRIFNTFGPNCRPDDGRMIPNFISQAIRGLAMTIYGSGEQTRSICYVDDTVTGIRKAATSPLASGEIINIGNPEERRVIDIALAVAQASGVEARFVYEPLPSDDPSRRCPDIGKARRLLGWEPVWTVADGLEHTLSWMKARLAEPENVVPSSPVT